MTRSPSIRSDVPSSLPLSLLAVVLVAACAQTPSRAGRVALDDYAKSFSPAAPHAIGSTAEITAPDLEVRDEGRLHYLSGAGEARPVHVRLLDTTQWQGVSRITAEAGHTSAPPSSAQLTSSELLSALDAGIVARDAAIRVVGNAVSLRLTDVELPASATSTATREPTHVDWLELVLHLGVSVDPSVAYLVGHHDTVGSNFTVRIGGD